MSDTLEPVRQESTVSIVAEQIRTSVVGGVFRPGQQLSEARLAQQLAVSRGPLREAMQRLVAEGLLRSERNRGVFVVDLDADDIRDIYLAREAVESHAAALLVRAGGGAATGRLTKIVTQMEEAAARPQPAGHTRRTSLADLDLRFHAELVTACGSTRLRRMMRTLLAETRICQRALQGHYTRSTDLAAEHRTLVAVIDAGDEQRAVALIHDHMADAVERLTGGWRNFSLAAAATAPTQPTPATRRGQP